MMVRQIGVAHLRPLQGSTTTLTAALGSGLRVAIVHARWNTTIIDQLVSGAMKSLRAAGVTDDNITVQTVPGSYELPLGVQR